MRRRGEGRKKKNKASQIGEVSTIKCKVYHSFLIFLTLGFSISSLMGMVGVDGDLMKHLKFGCKFLGFTITKSTDIEIGWRKLLKRMLSIFWGYVEVFK